MTLVHTSELKPDTFRAGGLDNLQVYNGLDCCLTMEVFEEISKEHEHPQIYSFERALQAPYLDIMRRGFAVDVLSRQQAAKSLHERLDKLGLWINQMSTAVWGRQLNPQSHVQIKDLFYGVMRIPEIYSYKKGQKKISTDRDALEKMDDYLYARPLVQAIMRYRDIKKQSEFLEKPLDEDYRFRPGYNITGTQTGRSSSSENSFGTGDNAQNIPEALRYPLVADPGYRMAVLDLEQSEARDVGYLCGALFGKWKFLDNCECLTEDHEVLTEKGWVPISQKPSMIMLWDKGQFYFSLVEQWNEGIVDETISVESSSISLRGTVEHRMPVYRHGEVNRLNSVHPRKLRYIKDHPTFIAPNNGYYCGGLRYEPHAELIAAFQADGTRDSKGKVHWSFTKQRKIIVLKQMLDSAKLTYSTYDLGSGATRIYLHQGQGQERWSKECGAEILFWEKKALEKFCASHYHWDAHIEGPQITITAKSKMHLEWLGTALTLIGKVVSIHVHKVDYWKLTIKTGNNHQYRSATIKTEYTAEKVWNVYCPTTKSGYFLVRRNNKIYISGNSGDLHTSNARLVWPDRLPWTGDLRKDRALAEQPWYRDQSYRYGAKRLGHLTDYMGTAFTSARILKIPMMEAEDFRQRYVTGPEAAYPEIAEYWEWIAKQLQTSYMLTTPFGRQRHFFARPNDDATLREAIAHIPQSMTADRMSLGMWRVWKYMPEVQLLANGYDSITFQYREGLDEAQIIGRAKELCIVPLEARGRKFIVPVEAKVGWNWGPEVTNSDIERARGKGQKLPRLNTDGLRKFDPNKRDTRTRTMGLRRIMM